MMFANLGFMATSGLLLASFVSGAFQLWHLYALTLINSAIAHASNSRRSRRRWRCWCRTRHRDRANAIGQMTGPAANAIAPALAGLLYAVIGVPGAILIDLATFARRHPGAAGGAHPDAGEDRGGRGDGRRGLAPGVRRPAPTSGARPTLLGSACWSAWSPS